MSESTLPERPHLNWLKNRAKEKLDQLRVADPESQLADAQLLIAREYGFTNWQMLRSRITLLAFQASLDTGDSSAMAELLADNPSLAVTTDATWTHPSGKRLTMPPLFTAACMRKNLEMVRSLVDAGANVNDPALFVDGRPDIMQFLLDRGMNPNAITFPENCTGLMFAAYVDDVENARLLIERGADPNIALKNCGSRALHWLPWRGETKDPLKTIATARLLIEAGAEVNARIFTGFDDQQITDQGNLYLVEQGGSTVLHTAAEKGMVTLVRLLLDAGADPNARTTSLLNEKSGTGERRWRYKSQNPGLTPRDLALAAGHHAVAQMFQNRSTSLQNSEEQMKDFADAILGDINVVRKMLDENPQLANATLQGSSMLHIAAGENRIAAIRLLIERGANPNAVWVGNLHTPLSWAVTVDHPEACRTLVECGAKADLFCAAGMGRLSEVRSFFDEAGRVRPGASTTGSSRRGTDGGTLALSTDPVEIISDALYIACRSGRVDVAIYLLGHGANPGFRGYMGASCFHWAYFGGGDPRLIDAILAHGGDPKSAWGERKLTPRAFGIFTTVGWGWMYYLKRILDADPSLVNFFEGGTTPLHEAAKFGNLDVVKLLVERGADRDRLDEQGQRAVDAAKAADRLAVVDWLSTPR